MSPWRTLRELLERGNGVAAAAAAAAGCSRLEIARMCGDASGRWSYLLDGVRDAKVLIVDEVPSAAPVHLALRGAGVAQADADPDRAAVRRFLARDVAGVDVGPPAQLLRRRWDIVCLDGVRVDPSVVGSLVSAMSPGGRLVIVAENALSPIRLAERVRTGSKHRTAIQPLRRIRRLLAQHELGVQRVYGVLRSSGLPQTAFDIDARGAAREVLATAATDIEGLELIALRAFSMLAGMGRCALLAPGWVVTGSSERSPNGLPIVGLVGFERTAGRILFGDPPRMLEKWYRTPREASAEALALSTLEMQGLRVAPRLLGRPDPRACQMTWRPGRTLGVKSLSHPQRVRWVGAAARLLRRIHDATRTPDGTVLVHGDYWLGNLLVADGDVSAVIDWGAARLASPTLDTDFLVDSLARYYRGRPRDLDELRARCGLEYSA